MKIKDISIEKHLQSHYGIGPTQSQAICNLLGISPLIKKNQLTGYEQKKL
jgi:ribosomal protein S13